MKQICRWGLLIALALILVACGVAEDEGPADEVPGEEIETEEATDQNGEGQTGETEDKGEVIFGVTPWSTTIPPTAIAQLILEEVGYQVTWREADVGLIYSGLASGDIDVFMDSWLPTLHATYMEQFGNQLDDLAVSYPEADLGWVVPSYVEEVNSIEDINAHVDLFDGKVYGIDEGAGMTRTSREVIEEYDLDIQYVASSEAAMLSQAATFIDAERPILFLGYRPHSMFAMWDLKLLDDPKGVWESSEVHVMAGQHFKDKAPEAHRILSKWNIPIDDIEEMILQIDEHGADPRQLAAEWIEKNRDKVDEMIS